MTEEKIATEVAEAEFERFLKTMYLRYDVEQMDAEDRKAFEEMKDVFVHAMLDGRLVVDDVGEPVFTPYSGGEPIVFHEPKGATFMTSDQHKDDRGVHKSFAMMAEMTGVPMVRFAKMPRRDLHVCQKIATLFLASS